MTSCEKEEAGGTATEAMAGEWYVTAVAVDESGEVVYEDEDLFGIGHFHLDTYNTSANTSTEMWIDDNTNFWEFKVKIKVDLASKTFGATDAQNAHYDNPEDCLVTITNGKILYGAATTPSKMPADSIVFNVTFSDDDYPAQYGYASYRISGYRYTGFENDD
ncbi:MAG: hypothetical protein LBT94_03325 [Prevotellaceae bacterium]|nr:hypothetical protein [Prevotellaceae bacterium]